MKKINDKNAIFFDYDGVITKPDDNIEAWKKACSEFGFAMTEKDWYELEGLKPKEIAVIVLKKYNIIGITPDQLAEEKKRQYEVILNGKGDKAGVYEGIKLILLYLKKKGVKLGLVTGATLSRISKSIPELKDSFDTIVAADSVDENRQEIPGKPSPSPWLFAAKNLNLPVDQCVAVENATLGIKSAKTAGLYCIALQTTLGKGSLKKAGADLVLENHKALLSFFQHSYE